MRTKLMARALRAEAAAGDWWSRMSREERRAYIEAHPRSKYAAGGPAADLPADQRPVSFPVSGLDPLAVGRKFDELHQSGADTVTVSVPHDRLRATQRGVQRPGFDRGASEEDVTRGHENPIGLRTADGDVHVIDGHHRADAAFRGRRPLTVDVYDVGDLTPRATDAHTRHPDAARQHYGIPARVYEGDFRRLHEALTADGWSHSRRSMGTFDNHTYRHPNGGVVSMDRPEDGMSTKPTVEGRR